MIREKSAVGVSGGWVLAAALAALVAAAVLLTDSAGHPGRQWLALGLGLAAIAVLPGLIMVSPNEGRVLQLFGDYIGTVRRPGLRWVNPLYSKRSVSLRVRNFETQSRMKVNDVDGNPIEVGVWSEVDLALGIRTVTVSIDRDRRQGPLWVELGESRGSPARVRIVGGK